MACELYVGDDLCVWCREFRSEHEIEECLQCGGLGLVPDPSDRVSRSEGLPVWAWRKIDCECACDGVGRVRRGGYRFVRGGGPVDDGTLDRLGVGMRVAV